MNIAIDFDDTITVDTTFWQQFILNAINDGHSVYLISSRTPTAENLTYIQTCLTEKIKIPIYLIHNEAKKDFIYRKNINIDIWIDNDPISIIYGR